MTQVTSASTLQIRRTFAAPREKVYRAWTDPVWLAKWYCQPAARHSCQSLSVDVRVGGRIRAEMLNRDTGETFVEYGEYREIVPNERLVFTFRWEDAEMDVGETLMTVEFADVAGATEVVMTHTGFPSSESRDAHNEGWLGCMEKFSEALASE